MRFKTDRDAPERLAVFARYPEPGRAKTRLIPALGPEGAAALHAEMTRRTLRLADELASIRGTLIEVWFTGGDLHQLQVAFGERFYRPQPDGDLGARMAGALAAMLADSRSAIIIGTDCPGLNPAILADAFEALRDHDLVLGPATDGGYYLIGLRAPAPALFDPMPWGTSRVLTETQARAERLGLAVHLLTPLDDIDEPGDLAVWDRFRADDQDRDPVPELSIVIPTLNEAAVIGETILAILTAGVEVIVADGGSADGTREIAAAAGARVIQAPPGRGPQQNAGAAQARAPRLLFLHADTRLPVEYLDLVRQTLANPSVALAAFRLGIDRQGLGMRAVELGVRIRCALWRMPYGDQAFFMRTEAFRRLGGFAEIPLMEDVDLVRRARALGRIQVVRAAVVTSGRRWESAGVFRMSLVNLSCAIGFRLGVSTTRLAAWRDRLSQTRAKPCQENRLDSP